MKKFKQSFKLRLTCIFILISAIPMLLLGFLTYSKSKSMLLNSSLDSIGILTKQTNMSLDEFLEGNEYKLESLSKDKGLITISKLTEQKDFLDKARKSEDAYYVQDNVKRQRIEDTRENMYSLTEDPSISTAYMAMPTKDMVSGKSQYIFNKTEKDTFDPTEREWYKEAVNAKGKVVWGKPYLDREKNIMLITASKAIYDNGNLFGVLAIDIKLDKFIGKVSQLKVGNEGQIFIIDNSNKYIFNPNKELIGKEIEDKSLAKALEEDSEIGTYQNNNFANKFIKNKHTQWKIMISLSRDELNSKVDSIKLFAGIITVIVLAVGITISLFISKKIISRLNELNDSFKKAANGDLTVKIDNVREDEFGQIASSFNKMIKDMNESFKEVVAISEIILENSKTLGEIGEQTKLSSTEVGNAIINISEEGVEQASGAQRGKERMDEFSSSLEDISKSIKSSNTLIKNTENSSKNGMKIVDDLTIKTTDIIENNDIIMKTVIDVNDSIKEIISVLSVIEGIAGQTNLLALNASIEAARAGEAGKGFTVVADEVRNLSEESTKSANIIKNIIKSIQDKSNTSVSAINSANSIFKEYVGMVDDTKEAFNLISNGIKDVYKEIMEVNSYNKLIIEDKKDIEKFIDKITQSIDTTSSTTEEISASIEETMAMMENLDGNVKDLYSLAQDLKEKVDKFTI